MPRSLAESRAGYSWADRVTSLRDRILASPNFRRWAARTPLVRQIARRRARALFDLCAGFVYSQVLLSCVRLRLFETLLSAPLTVAEIAEKLGLPGNATARLVHAATALKLLSKRDGGRIGLGPLGVAMIGNTGVAAMVEHHAILYADLADPIPLLLGSRGDPGLAAYWPYAGAAQPSALGPEQVAPYSGLMSASQPLISEEILQAYPVRRHRHLVDVGGGEGVFIAAAGASAPHLKLTLFDLPNVADRARLMMAARGIEGRAQAIGGDFFRDELPRGGDLISLVRIVHDHDNAAALSLLRRAHEALQPGGTILIAEPLAGTPGTEPITDAYFGFYLLAMGHGRTRTFAEIRALLTAAGFDRVRQAATNMPLLTGVVVARRA